MAKKNVKQSVRKQLSKPQSVTKSIAKHSTKKTTKPRLQARQFFTISDDAYILTTLAKKDKLPQSARALQLANHLNRSVESIRDRIKRYLTKISPTEQAQVKNAAKKTPNYYVHFTSGKGKSILSINARHPSAYKKNVYGLLSDTPTTPKMSKLVSRVSRRRSFGAPAHENFDWIIKKMNDKDPYFSLDNAVSLISDMLNYFIETQQATTADVEKFIRDTRQQINLEDVFKHFNPQE